MVSMARDVAKVMEEVKEEVGDFNVFRSRRSYLIPLNVAMVLQPSDLNRSSPQRGGWRCGLCGFDPPGNRRRI
ncbi:hypothetical protein EYF80_049076 [Liparis tanakae]|uniref:Uncharacterized protein n=1 Tax=Liparis tanakae TaxID=230148 RepID=A0A4Z2FII9_9TELE|nr:hypothetical protein EYF80_049076 [Liparis tanakae]